MHGFIDGLSMPGFDVGANRNLNSVGYILYSLDHLIKWDCLTVRIPFRNGNACTCCTDRLKSTLFKHFGTNNIPGIRENEQIIPLMKLVKLLCLLQLFVIHNTPSLNRNL